MCRPPSSGRIWQRACGLPYPASSRQSRPSVALHVCVLTGAPRRRRPGRCLPFHAPIPPQRRPIVQRCPTGGRRWFPGQSSPVALPRTLPRPFWAHHCRLCWSSAGADGVPSSAGNGAGSGRWHPLRALPAIQLWSRRWSYSYVRTYVLGRNRLPVSHFPNRFPVLKPVTGFPVPV